MKNLLNYYYNLNPTSIHRINKDYKCYVGNDEYLLMQVEDEAINYYEVYQATLLLIQNGILCHLIILNINNQIITEIDNNKYILQKVNIKNRMVDINDIYYFSKAYVNYPITELLPKFNWKNMWIKKIDYIEYQISQCGKKYPKIRESISYYIGMAENSISLLNLQNSDNKFLVVSHRRIKKKDGLIDFYNPLNFILDNNVRDLVEYIKEQFFFSNYSFESAKEDILKMDVTIDSYNLLFIRLIFPSYYFDMYEQITTGYLDENEITKITSKSESYRVFLKKLYYYLSNFTRIIEIEWILK